MNATQLRFITLGSLRIFWGQKEIDATTWRHKRAAALLRILIQSPSFRIRAEELETRLWPESTAGAARTNLRVKIFELRALLGDFSSPDGLRTDQSPITFEGGVVAINPDFGPVVDAYDFEDLALTALDYPDSDREKILAIGREALDLWKGDFFEDEFDAGTVSLRERFSRVRRELVRRLVELDEAAGNSRFETDLARAFSDYPADGNLAAQYIGLLSRQSRRARAREAYHAHAQALKAASGHEPAPRLALLAGEFTASPVLQRRPEPPLVDRKQEINVVSEWLTRLDLGHGGIYSIYGAGGTGKSRFAREIVEMAAQKSIAVGLGRAYRNGPADVPIHEIAHALRGYASDEAIEAYFDSDTLHTGLTRLLRRITERAKVLMIIDDAHFYEKSSLDELQAAVAETAGVALILAWRGEPAFQYGTQTKLHLTPLDRAFSAEIVKGCFAGNITAKSCEAISNLWPGQLSVITSCCEFVQREGLAIRESGLWHLKEGLGPADLMSESVHTTAIDACRSASQDGANTLQALYFAVTATDEDLGRLLGVPLEEVRYAVADLAALNLVTPGPAIGLPAAVRTVMADLIPLSRQQFFERRLGSSATRP